ncbi:MAG: cytoplasmic protein [Nitrospirae bacterium]|nr:cytoplasmic protein [Nitrospirota bacterium]
MCPQSTSPSFQNLQASALYCPRCRTARPVRERLLLILPDGELYEYRCAACGAEVGTRRATAAPRGLPLIA